MAETQTTQVTFGRQRGVCSVCGKDLLNDPDEDGRSTKCNEHRGRRTGTNVPPDTGTMRVDRPGPPPSTDDESAKRRKVLEASILADLNPALVQGYAMICRPIPPENFYTVHGDSIRLTELGEQIAFSGMEANIMARGLVELEKSPIATTAQTVMAPFLPILWGIGTAAVVGIHGAKLFALRDQLIAGYQKALEDAQSVQNAAAGNGSAPAASGEPPVTSTAPPEPDAAPNGSGLPDMEPDIPGAV